MKISRGCVINTRGLQLYIKSQKTTRITRTRTEEEDSVQSLCTTSLTGGITSVDSIA